MKIGELAKKAGTSVETIRYYEQAGLLPKTMRSEGNYRIYSSPHLERLIFVRHCRSLDMTLDEIRILLNFKASPDENCAMVNQLLDEHIGHVAQRIVELQELCWTSTSATLLNELSNCRNWSGNCVNYASAVPTIARCSTAAS